MARRSFVCMAALAALVVTGCRSSRCPPPAERVLDIGCVDSSGPIKLDRGDWTVSQRTAVWKVMEARVDLPPHAIGYLVQRKYRQMRGGPTYGMYEVTSLHRDEPLGRIDSMGRAWRYVPQRNAGVGEVDLGINTLENDLAAIFQTSRVVTLEKTTERRLAFEALDRDGSGVLEQAEMEGHGDRLRNADRNRDGVVDFDEFDAIPVL